MSALSRAPFRHSAVARRWGWLRRTSWVVAAVAAFVPVFGYTYLYAGVDQIEATSVTTLLGEPSTRPSPPPGDPEDGDEGRWVNILLMGSDQRDGANGRIGGHVGGMRNDTTILMHIAADRSRVEFISIPRDSLVKVPDCLLSDGTVVKGWTGKFNIAFANGGREGSAFDAAACTMHTVETLTDIYIEHFVVVDFSGFAAMVDALEGVPMCIPGRIVAKHAKVDLQPGPQLLNGSQALGWVRLRTAEVGKQWVTGSDILRIQRQQELLAHMIERALTKKVLTNLVTLTNFIEAGAATLKMNTELKDGLVALAWSLKDIRPEDIVFTTVPIKAAPNRSDVLWSTKSESLFNLIKADEPIAGTSVLDASDAGTQPSASPGSVPVPEGEEDPLALVSACEAETS